MHRPRTRGWARVDASRDLRRHQVEGLAFRRRAASWADRNPFLTAIYAHLAIALVAILGFMHPQPFLESLAPAHPDEILAVAWQVHAGFSGIAFAGLVLLIDMAGRGSHVTVTSERQFLLRHTQFLLAFMFALLGAVQVSAIATWFPSDATVFVVLAFIVIPSIYLVGRGYLRAVNALTLPGYVELAEREALRERMHASMDTSHVLSAANEALEQVMERAWVVGTPDADGDNYLVLSSGRSRLIDVHLPTLRDIIASLNSASSGASEVLDMPREASPPSPVKIGILAYIGQTIDTGRHLFAVSNSKGLTSAELRKLERKLSNAVHLEDE